MGSNELLSVVSGLIPAILAFVGGAVTAYFAWRNKQLETEPDADRALGDLQVQLAKAAENMVEPLNRQIEVLQHRLSAKGEELDLLRTTVREQSNRIGALEAENAELKKKIGDLETAKTAAEKRANQIAARLNRIKKEIDTGPLGSGKHKIPKDKGED